MSFKIITTKEGDPDRTELVFDQDSIVIGRSESNDLCLYDPRSIVSKQHAKIEFNGGAFYLTDLGSKNCTYLNNSKLDAGRAYALENGDLVKIGEYVLQFVALSTAIQATPNYDRTIFAGAYANPFEDSIKKLEDALVQVYRVYGREQPSNRDDHLREAFDNFAPSARRSEASRILAYLLNPTLVSTYMRDQAARDRQAAPAPPPPPPVQAPPPPPPPVRVDDERRARFFDVLIPVVAAIFRDKWDFQLDFIGQTVMEAPGLGPLYSGSIEDLKRFLLDPNLPEAEWKQRFARVEEKLKGLEAYPRALMAGYKHSIPEGARALLDELKPVEAPAPEIDPNKTYIPTSRPTAPATGASIPLDKHRALTEAAATTVEKRFFRSPFIKGYQKGG